MSPTFVSDYSLIPVVLNPISPAFNSSISQADEFSTSEGPLGVKYYLKDFYTNFISGKMNMKKFIWMPPMMVFLVC